MSRRHGTLEYNILNSNRATDNSISIGVKVQEMTRHRLRTWADHLFPQLLVTSEARNSASHE